MVKVVHMASARAYRHPASAYMKRGLYILGKECLRKNEMMIIMMMAMRKGKGIGTDDRAVRT